MPGSQTQTHGRTDFMQFSLRQFSTRSKERLPPEDRETPRQVKRWFAIGVTSVIVLLFVYHATSAGGFLGVKQISISGINHYTQEDIEIAALGLNPNRSNVHTISEQAVESRLKQLIYVKRADISKNVVTRSLTIQIIEREPVALLKYRVNRNIHFLLVDLDGYVLEYRGTQASDRIVTIVGDGGQLPKLGSQVDSEGVQLALRLLRSALGLIPESVSRLRIIDANQPEKIALQLDDLPVAWLSYDLIEIGLYHLNQLLKNQTTILKKRNRTAKDLGGYLDTRFEDAIYWGDKHG
jgi:cell division septal protein FtsQ